MSDDQGAGSKTLQRVAWGISLVSCSYFAWIYLQMDRITQVFSNMFVSMGIELPVATAFLINNHRWLYPLLFVGAGALVAAKEFLMRDKKASIAATFAVGLCVLYAVNYIHQTLYAPLIAVVEKLK